MILNKIGTYKPCTATIANVLLCLLISFVWVLPFGWILSTSMRLPSEAYTVPPAFFPEQLDLSNYVKVFYTIPILTFMWNSFFMSFVTTMLMLLITSMAAYGTARIRFKGSRVVTLLLISGMMIPIASILVPLFYTMKEVGLANSKWAVILLGIYHPISFLMLHNFFLTIPRSYDEAAYMDGAGRIHIFIHVILPMSTSSLLVCGLLCFVNNWNNFLVPLIFLSNMKDYTITLGLQFLKSSFARDTTLILAGVIIALLPPILLYCFCSKYLLQGIMITGLKS
jgi:multiple sugar transport system permease protein